MESARTNISFLDPADFEEALEIFLALGALDYIQPLRFLDRAGHLNRLYEKHDEMISGTNYHLSCRLKENKQLVALLNLSGMGGSGRKFIGYIIRKDDWGKGFASELTEWIINFAREKTNFIELHAIVEGNNAISKHILKKNGFEKIEVKVEEDGCVVETYGLKL